MDGVVDRIMGPLLVCAAVERPSIAVMREGGLRYAGAVIPSERQAGPPGASISSTRTPWHERGWMNATGPSAPRRGTLSMSSRPSISRRSRVSARLATSKQTWWKPSPFDGQEAGDAGRVVGRLDELDLGLADAQERDPDAVVSGCP